MFCPECGKEIPDVSRFCLSCGHSMDAIAMLSGRQDEPAFAPQPTDNPQAPTLQVPDSPEAKDEESRSDQGLDNSVGPGRSRASRTVTTIDDSLQILADRGLNADIVASLPKGTEVELGETSTVDGREWIAAKLKAGASGFVLAPSARGHTTLASESMVLVGIAPAEKSAQQKPPDPLAGVGGWLIVLILVLLAGALLSPLALLTMGEILTSPWFFTGAILTGVLSGSYVFVAVALLNRWPSAPKLAQRTFIASWAAWTVFVIAAGVAGAGGLGVERVIGSLVGTLLWVRYLGESWRVHVTYGPMPRGRVRRGHAMALAAAVGLLIVLAAVGIAGHRKQAWGQFQPSDGTYRVEAPGVARKSTLADGTTQVVFGNDTRAFAVLDSVVAQENSTTQVYFQRLRDQTISGMKGTMSSSSPSNLDGHPGLQFSATVPGNGATGDLYGRIYRAGSKGFMLLVSGPQGGRIQAEADSFFRSFHIRADTQ